MIPGEIRFCDCKQTAENINKDHICFLISGHESPNGIIQKGWGTGQQAFDFKKRSSCGRKQGKDGETCQDLWKVGGESKSRSAWTIPKLEDEIQEYGWLEGSETTSIWGTIEKS